MAPTAFQAPARASLLGLALFTVSAVGVAASDVAPSADQVRPPLVGSSAPDVDVRSIDGKTVALDELIEGKPTVLIFYRGGW